ncbi:hypothetical protein [Micromonospora sp. RTP1Z1]|uniref:hypothetical protein n=1 Tax=Micromonospora sp. RTP1Z1 TaxID=2994043 RepID=UPI0029C65E14|nr:hypothetical protein [Micromonospora sp. RTP1Z1]
MELRRALHKPFEVPIIVATNGTTMTLAWFFLPPSLINLLFTFHGPLAFPMVLAGWMYSDVPATNLLGSDARRSSRMLGDRTALRHSQRAKNLVLWLLVSPLAAVIAIAVGMHDKRPLVTVFTVLWIAVVPLGALGVAAWLGVFFPYHAVPLKQRWTHRRPFRRKIVRWLILAMTPWMLIPGLVLLISLPTVGLWAATYHSWRGQRIPEIYFVTGVAMGCAVAALFWIFGARLGARFAQRRRDKLASFLADPDRG